MLFSFPSLSLVSAETICPKGHYCQSGVKTICPEGYYAASLGVSADTCSGECSPGSHCAAGSKSQSPAACSEGTNAMDFYCPNGKRLPIPDGFFGSAGGCYRDGVITEPCEEANCKCERSAIEACYVDYNCESGLPKPNLQVHAAALAQGPHASAKAILPSFLVPADTRARAR